MNRLLTVFLALICCLPLLAAQTDYAKRIAPLIDSTKLATLGKRGANQRVQKAVYWLAEALTKAALLRNLDIDQKLGCLDADGMVGRRCQSLGRAA